MAEEKKKRDGFGSKIGIIAAAAGSAIGLGNIYRFPCELGNNGGAAFLLVYLAVVIFLGIPVMLSELVIGRRSQSPDLVIGTSMGAMYAQQLHGIARICINPCFALSKCYFILSVGKHKWLNKRRDGATDFHVYKETIQHFAEMEERQFDGIDDEDKTLCHGLFGDADPVARESRPVFASHYPGMDRGFEGGHRMNAELVASVLFPFIRENLPWF